MIIDYKNDPDTARLYSVVAADTGECLDAESVCYADDKTGYYHRYSIDADGFRWVWDGRTKLRLTGKLADLCIPREFIEVAWERVDRPIRLVPKKVCCWCDIDLLPEERFACRECGDFCKRNGHAVEKMRHTNMLSPRVGRALMDKAWRRA